MIPDPLPPLVVVCLRHTDLRPDVDPLTGQLHRDARGARPAPQEEAALEHGLRLGRAWGAPVLAVCAGPPAVEATLRLALAAGAQALRVGRPPGGTADAASAYLGDLVTDGRALARAVLAAVTAHAGRVPSLILCGDRSADRGTGTLPAMLAHESGAAQALGLVDLRPDPSGDGDRGPGLIAERRLDRGRRELLRMRLPAVCSVEAAGVALPRAGLAAVLAAQQSPVPAAPAGSGRDPWPDTDSRRRRLPPEPVVLSARPLRPRTRVVLPPEGSDPVDRLHALTGVAVAHEPPTVVGPVGAERAADVLLEYLRRHGYLAEEGP